MSFHEFPKTPHMGGSHVVDDDQVLSPQEIQAICSRKGIQTITAQEKVDGSNVSVHFDQPYKPIIQKRSGLIKNTDRKQYLAFRDYVYQNLNELYELLGEKFCLFGEWLWATHAVSYNALPDYFIVFDLLEKSTQKFLSYNRLQELAGASFKLVPLVKQWRVSEVNIKSFQAEITKLLNKKSFFGEEPQEGLYLRFEEEQYVQFRSKIRRKTFVSGRDDFDTKIINNKLKS